jgi:hypothetical protein
MNALDALNELADRLGWPQITTLDKPPLTKQTRKLLRLMNRVLRTISGIQDWPLMRKSGTIVLVASEVTDSSNDEWMVATRNSDVVTIQNATFDDSYVTRAFQAAGDPVIYRIIAVPAPTQLQLDRAWVSDDVALIDERSWTIAVDNYALPTDFDRPLTDAQAFFAPYSIQPIDPDKFERIRRTDRGITLGEPKYFTIYGMNAAQTAYVIHFHPWPKEQRLLRYPYQMVHPEINSDNDKILFPQRYVSAIMEMVLQLALRDYEDDAKVEQALVDMLRTYNQQVANPDVTGTRLRLGKSGRIRRRMQRSFGFGGDRIDWGNWFDKSDVYGIGEW